jgi:hypothetical protein
MFMPDPRSQLLSIQDPRILDAISNNSYKKEVHAKLVFIHLQTGNEKNLRQVKENYTIFP